jgi:hypothetical protein
MVRFLLALASILALTALPVQASPLAQPAQPATVRLVQGTDGALYLVQGTDAWPIVPAQYPDEVLATIPIQGEVHGTLPTIPRHVPPRPPTLGQGSDGTLYIVDESSAWSLVPDPISDAELASLNVGDEIADGSITLDLTGGTAPTGPLPAAGARGSPGAGPPSNLSRFVGVWEGHARRLEVRGDGSASMVFGSAFGPDLNLTLKFTASSPTVATGQVVVTNSPRHPVGEAATLTLNDDDTVSPTLGGEPIFDFCGPGTPAGYCGA